MQTSEMCPKSKGTWHKHLDLHETSSSSISQSHICDSPSGSRGNTWDVWWCHSMQCHFPQSHCPLWISSASLLGSLLSTGLGLQPSGKINKKKTCGFVPSSGDQSCYPSCPVHSSCPVHWRWDSSFQGSPPIISGPPQMACLHHFSSLG